jgi:hypothetical protein
MHASLFRGSTLEEAFWIVAMPFVWIAYPLFL